jgi:SAM-dependent methyltransferase
VNIDIVKADGVDVVHDLDVAPWPWDDDSAEQIAAVDIFEHVNNPITFMTECHRVLAPGGLLKIVTTYYQSPASYHTDPTHKRASTEHTFDYWIPGRKFFNTDVELFRLNPFYGGVSFRLVMMVAVPGEELKVTLRKPIAEA